MQLSDAEGDMFIGRDSKAFRQPGGVGDPMHASTFNVRNLGDPDAISVLIFSENKL